MGLNHPHPLAPYRGPDDRSRDTAEAVGPRDTESVDMDDYMETLGEEEENDLAELAERIVPEELRSLAQQHEESSDYGFQPFNKNRTSRYTGWQSSFGGNLNPKGWQLTDSAGISNIPEEIYPSSGPMDGVETEEQFEDVDDFPQMDEKYFDHYGYLNYVNDVDGSKDGDKTNPSPKVKKPALQFKLKVPDEKGVKLGFDESLLKSPSPKKPLASMRQSTKPSGKTLATGGTSMNDADKPLGNAAEVHDEASQGASPGTSSDETGMWELLEGNVDAPRTGNISPHKLIIKLRHVVTDERKTLTYTAVEHDEVDWKSKQQIASIIKWRTEVFHAHGLSTKKNVMMYTPLEDAWMTLFHLKLRATIEAGHIIKLPGPANLMALFNAYFEGKELKDASGETVGPRPARDANSIRGKLDGRRSKIAEKRKEMRGILGKDNGSPMFMPDITEEELEKFQKDGTVAVDDPKDDGKNASLGSGGKKSKKSSPKQKREKDDTGEQDVKKAKK
ncbi:hypothetical protein G6011_11774 [Alternaria panax]|uniref:Uncharacterized protein n=1 Tax=Alternaria panax TaxID=48097 RepID=A0AAD4F6Z3_9PLEO|nr:hypothetical protein G6011_11774 [Alternaria panax]